MGSLTGNTGLALADESSAAQTAATTGSASAGRQYYLIRRYRLQNGPQTRLAQSYLADALLPALGRLGMGPVGAFKLDVGPQTPAYFLIIPSTSVEALALLDLRLAEDDGFLQAAQPFWSAPATAPAFVRVESSLFAAFPGWPRLTPPAGAAATNPNRIVQLRTYESPSYAAHVRKVEMFHNGEFEVFKNAGAAPVFFGDALIGESLPQLTYMLAFESQEALTAAWKRFGADPAWKKLSSSPRYAYEEIVSSITNLVLSPLASSQL